MNNAQVKSLPIDIKKKQSKVTVKKQRKRRKGKKERESQFPRNKSITETCRQVGRRIYKKTKKGRIKIQYNSYEIQF